MMDRRYFLKSGALALASFAAAPSFLLRAATQEKKAGKPVVIAVFQRGAADGISMVVPFGDPYYASARKQTAIASPIDLDGFFGLHPALASLKPIYDAGHLAVVHAIGSTDNTRSHFDAQDYMESGAPGNKSVADGWMNRYLQTRASSATSPFRAVALGTNVPRSLMGNAPAVAMTRIGDFGVRTAASAFEALYGHEAFDAVHLLKEANPQQYAAANEASYPASTFGQSLLQVAQLIKSDIGLELAFVDIGGWDTHANQGNDSGQLANRLTEFGQGLSALYRDLGDRMENVVVVTMTEFGRSIRQNGSGGTDHGHASSLFVLGGPVKGGKVYGRWPGLAPEQLHEGRDLALTTDFRDLFSQILITHMDTPDVSRIFPGFSPGPRLGII